MDNWLIGFLQVSNEAITATTVIIAASFVLYNLSHNIHDRVVRASSVVLGCVTAAYIGAVFVGLGTHNPTARLEAWMRFQWIGIAFIPAALFHLSDALLETTGLTSRGRRRRITRILYLYGIVFLLIATGTNLLVYGFTRDPNGIMFPTMYAGPLFPLFLVYFFGVTIISVNNVVRARRRSLTAVTYRRMTYLLLTFPMPAIGIFPYALILPRSPDSAIYVWLLVNLGNIAVAFSLAFMGYPLAFFGQSRPDRVIKGELLRFFLRGPVTAIAVLVAVLFFQPATRTLGIPGTDLLPFVAVVTVLMMQWGIAVTLPTLDKWLVYGRDQEDALQLREVGEHLLTEADAKQLLETILAALCEYLRSPSAFVISFNAGAAHLESSIGSLAPSNSWLASPELSVYAEDSDQLPSGAQEVEGIVIWQSYWLVPLTSERLAPTSGQPNRLIGLLGVWPRSPQPDLAAEEQQVFTALCQRAARVLDDTRLQAEIVAALKGLLPEIDAVQQLSGPARHGSAPALAATPSQIVKQPDFTDLIRDALRDYWGGPRLTDGRLLQLSIVRQALRDNDGNPARAVRAVLRQAIESLRPEGQPRTTNEWVLYNVLDMRFVQGQKVLEVADKLAMSEANLHRKQRVAIEQVAQRVSEMEQQAETA